MFFSPQKLQDVKPDYSDDSFVTAKSKENIHKNSVHDIPPSKSTCFRG